MFFCLKSNKYIKYKIWSFNRPEIFRKSPYRILKMGNGISMNSSPDMLQSGWRWLGIDSLLASTNQSQGPVIADQSETGVQSRQSNSSTRGWNGLTSQYHFYKQLVLRLQFDDKYEVLSSQIDWIDLEHF